MNYLFIDPFQRYRKDTRNIEDVEYEDLSYGLNDDNAEPRYD